MIRPKVLLVSSLFVVGSALFPVTSTLLGQVQLEASAQTSMWGDFGKIRNKAWGKCLNLQEDNNYNGGLPNVWDCVSHSDQEWRIYPARDGYYKIRNEAWGKCLNLQEDNNYNGGFPNVWDCVSHSDQEWRIYPTRDGSYKIRNKAWGKCLNLQEDNNYSGGLPNVWDCVSHSDQEWSVDLNE